MRAVHPADKAAGQSQEIPPEWRPVSTFPSGSVEWSGSGNGQVHNGSNPLPEWPRDRRIVRHTNKVLHKLKNTRYTYSNNWSQAGRTREVLLARKVRQL